MSHEASINYDMTGCYGNCSSKDITIVFVKLGVDHKPLAVRWTNGVNHSCTKFRSHTETLWPY